ncbi:MAG: hypothetical protein ACYCU7_19010 [Acidimicrobiales bacterium]
MSDERYAFRCSCGCSLVSTLPGSANCPDCDKEMEPADAIPTPAPTAPTQPAQTEDSIDGGIGPVASCLLCGRLREMAIWHIDTSIGVCTQCRAAALRLPLTGDLLSRIAADAWADGPGLRGTPWALVKEGDRQAWLMEVQAIAQSVTKNTAPTAPAQAGDWQQMTDTERGIIRCGGCGFGWGAEHIDPADVGTFTCPDCGAIRQADGGWVVPLQTVSADNEPPCVHDGCESQREDSVVHYYHTPSGDGEERCKSCGRTMHCHGWIDTLEGRRIVCPGDWVITRVKGEREPTAPTTPALGQTIGQLVYCGRGTPNPHPVQFHDEEPPQPAPTAPAQPKAPQRTAHCLRCGSEHPWPPRERWSDGTGVCPTCAPPKLTPDVVEALVGVLKQSYRNTPDDDSFDDLMGNLARAAIAWMEEQGHAI